MTDDAADPLLTEAQELLKRAIDQANTIQEMLLRADMHPSREILIALTIVTATAAQQFGLSPNDAFSLFLAVFEGSHDQEQERLGKMVKAMQNGIADVVERAIVNTPKPPTTH